MENYFSFSDPLSSGIDFYKTDEGAPIIIAQSELSSVSNTTVSLTKIINIASATTSDISVTIVSKKISFGASQISGILDVSLNAVFERQDALIEILASSNVVTNIQKFAFSESNIQISATSLFESEKISFAASSSTASVDAVILGKKIAISGSQIASSTNVVSDITKIIHIASEISGLLDVTLVAVFERQDGSVNVASEVVVSTSITKIAFSAVEQNISSNAVIDITKIALSETSISVNANVAETTILKTALAASSVSPSASALATIKKIAFAQSSISTTVTLTTAGKIFLATIRINILNNTNIVVKPIRFSANVVSDNSLIRNLLLLDNKSLTNQTRTFAINATPKFIENENWQGDVSRYYKNTSASKGAKRTFNLDWSFIPNEASFTVDLRESRNFLKQIAQDSDVHSLTIINQDVDGVTPYTEDNIDVFITSYSETLIRRDLSSESYYFSCNMVLEEA